MTNILIVEDEERITTFVQRGLRAAGYAATVAPTGAEALRLVRTGAFELIILDIGLPDMDGFELLRVVRGEGVEVPVIVLTARDAITDLVQGFDRGADDYITKPFKFDELLARVRARLRDKESAVDTVLSHDGVVLDLLSRRVTVDGVAADLSAREFTLAEEFLRHPDEVLSREQLLSRVWGYDFDPGSNVVDVYVRYLRQKIGADRIETVRGMGYRLR